MQYTQDDRMLALETPLGKDRLLLAGISGEEQVSTLFRYRLDMLSTDLSIQPADLVGKTVTAKIRMADGNYRPINGHVHRFMAGGVTVQGLRRYSAEIVPWLWFLTQSTDCRAFQDRTVPEIVETVFGEFGFGDYELAVQDDHPAWEYCVQYNETYYDFVARLLETEGIFYFFEHHQQSHRLIVADRNSAFRDGLESPVDYHPAGGAAGQITDWRHDYHFQASRYAANDYNFADPEIPLRVQRNTMAPLPGMDRYEVYEWPGNYYNVGDRDTVLRNRLLERETRYHEVDGAGRCAGFQPGTKVALGDHPAEEERGKAYALIAVRHEARDNSYLAKKAEDATYQYENTFTCFPLGAEVQYRPPRRTPKPVIHGAQTAVVVGPPGEDIYCDDYARIKVQFHWDRHGRYQDDSSCWVRVSQVWAGKDWGSLHLPHVGQEVLVSFLEGDPNRPIVSGRLYNADQVNPLVAETVSNKTRSMLRDQGGNEFEMEGMAGGEAMFFYCPQGSTQRRLGRPTERRSAGAGNTLEDADAFFSKMKGDPSSYQESWFDQAFDNNWTTDASRTDEDSVSLTYGNSYSFTDADAYAMTKGDTRKKYNGDVHKWTKGLAKATHIGRKETYLHAGVFKLSTAATQNIYIGLKSTLYIGESFKIFLGGQHDFNLSWKFGFFLLKHEYIIAKGETKLKEYNFWLTRTDTALNQTVTMGQDLRNYLSEKRNALSQSIASLNIRENAMSALQNYANAMQTGGMHMNMAGMIMMG